MNKLVIVLSAIICPIMIILVICNCYIKYKRKQYLEKVRIAQADIEQRMKASHERRMSRRASALQIQNEAQLRNTLVREQARLEAEKDKHRSDDSESGSSEESGSSSDDEESYDSQSEDQ